MELGPFALTSNTCWCMGNMDIVTLWLVVAFARDVDELKDEWPPRYDAAAAWKEVSADNVFEYRGLARRLRADHDLERLAGSRDVHSIPRPGQRIERTIWGRSRESLPMVLKTRSWSLLTIPSRSSPSAAILGASDQGPGFRYACPRGGWKNTEEKSVTVARENPVETGDREEVGRQRSPCNCVRPVGIL